VRRLLLGAVGLVAGAAITFGVLWPGRARAPGSATDTEARAADDPVSSRVDQASLIASIARLEKRLAMLELAQATTAAARGSGRADPEGKPTTQPDPAALMGLAWDNETETAAEIDHRLRTEPRDRAWAPTAEGELKDAVRAAVDQGAQFSIRTLGCLTSLCELVLSAATSDHLHNAALQLGHRINGMSSFRVGRPESDADGSAVVTYRLFRQGYPAPGE
jgi:hypothetical protein